MHAPGLALLFDILEAAIDDRVDRVAACARRPVAAALPGRGGRRDLARSLRPRSLWPRPSWLGRAPPARRSRAVAHRPRSVRRRPADAVPRARCQLPPAARRFGRPRLPPAGVAASVGRRRGGGAARGCAPPGSAAVPPPIRSGWGAPATDDRRPARRTAARDGVCRRGTRSCAGPAPARRVAPHRGRRAVPVGTGSLCPAAARVPRPRGDAGGCATEAAAGPERAPSAASLPASAAHLGAAMLGRGFSRGGVGGVSRVSGPARRFRLKTFRPRAPG